MNADPRGAAGGGAADEARAGFAALDHLATMVAVARADGHCVFANAAFESVLGLSRRNVLRGRIYDWFTEPDAVAATVAAVARNDYATSRFEALLRRPGPGEPLPVHVIVNQIDRGPDVIVEMVEIEQQTRQDREERLQDQVQANKELIRNLAHEIKNPLGGIRGAAQLLGMEVEDRALGEYTQVIIAEADRLQALVDRLLAPHRHARVEAELNIHEVFERVRKVVQAEYPQSLVIDRDYDASIPDMRGDKEQMIQVVLNLVRNAAQALEGQGRILLTTRVARQVTIVKQRHRLALDLHVIDNGPGIPESIRDRIFFPLVSGREGGSGLGLSLAQSFVQQHGGLIECESRPGRTDFRILLPMS